MYQATIGQPRAQTSSGKRVVGASQTPVMKQSSKMFKTGENWNNGNASKSTSKLAMTAKREQIRRFGEYNGEDGIEG